MEDQQPAADGLTDEVGAESEAETEAAQPESDAPWAEFATGEAEGRQSGRTIAWVAVCGLVAVAGVVGAVFAALAGWWLLVASSAAGAVAFAVMAISSISSMNRRPVGKASIIAAAVGVVLFVGSAAFAGATVQPYLKDQATVDTKLKIEATAAYAITTLFSYKPDNVEKLPDRAAQILSGDFEADYRKFIDAMVPHIKQAQITNSTEVIGAATESLNGPDATALVYTNTTSTTPPTKDMPTLKYLSYRVFMKRDHAQWLVARMTTITSVDLTPQL